MDLLFRASTATDVHGFFPRFRFFLGQYRPCIIYIYIHLYCICFFYKRTLINREGRKNHVAAINFYVTLPFSLTRTFYTRIFLPFIFFCSRKRVTRAGVLHALCIKAQVDLPTKKKKISSTQTSYCVYSLHT
jgi:hypothetical protein